MSYLQQQFQPDAIENLEWIVNQASATKQSLYNHVEINAGQAFRYLAKGKRIYTIECVEAMRGFYVVYYCMSEENVLKRVDAKTDKTITTLDYLDFKSFNQVKWYLAHKDLEVDGNVPSNIKEHLVPPGEGIDVILEGKKPSSQEEGVDFIYVPTGDGETSIAVHKGAILKFPQTMVLTKRPDPKWYTIKEQYGMISGILDKNNIVAYLKTLSGDYKEFSVSRNGVNDSWVFKNLPETAYDGVVGVDVIYGVTEQYGKTIPIKLGERVYVREGIVYLEGRKYRYQSQQTKVERFVSKEDMEVRLKLKLDTGDENKYPYKNKDIIINWRELEGMTMEVQEDESE